MPTMPKTQGRVNGYLRALRGIESPVVLARKGAQIWTM